jgi:hypothetical protein
VADVATDGQLEFLRHLREGDDLVARLLLVGAVPWGAWAPGNPVVDACLPMPWQPGALATLLGETVTAVRLARGTEPPPR